MERLDHQRKQGPRHRHTQQAVLHRYWEQPEPEGRKKYSKTAPLQPADLADLATWWDARSEDPRAWKVDGTALIERDDAGQIRTVNLDLKNPNAKAAEDHRAPAEILEAALAKEREVLAILDRMKVLVAQRELA